MNADQIPSHFIDGYKKFCQLYHRDDYKEYRQTAHYLQKPQIMVIACSDSRINPAILLQAKLGEIFVIHNVANLVPSRQDIKINPGGISVIAALEFAILHLKVKHVIILGHSNCGGIEALMSADNVPEKNQGYDFIYPWVQIGQKAKRETLQKITSSFADQCQYCERQSIINSLTNLRSFPWVNTAVDKGQLAIHGWYFNIADAVIKSFCPERNKFVNLIS